MFRRGPIAKFAQLKSIAIVNFFNLMSIFFFVSRFILSLWTHSIYFSRVQGGLCDFHAKTSSQHVIKTLCQKKLEIEAMKWELIVDPSRESIFNWQYFVFLVELKRFSGIPFERNPLDYRVSTALSTALFHVFIEYLLVCASDSLKFSWMANTRRIGRKKQTVIAIRTHKAQTILSIHHAFLSTKQHFRSLFASFDNISKNKLKLKISSIWDKYK